MSRAGTIISPECFGDYQDLGLHSKDGKCRVVVLILACCSAVCCVCQMRMAFDDWALLRQHQQYVTDGMVLIMTWHYDAVLI